MCHTYPAMMKLGTVIPYLKKIQKIYKSCGTPPGFYWHHQIFNGNWQILLYQETQIWIAFWYIISDSFNFSWIFEGFWINLALILIMSAKIPTPVIFQITLFWNKGYDFIIHVDHVTNRISSRDSNNIVDLFMWPNFGNPRISTNEVITTSILQGFGQKKTLFWGMVSVQVQ